MTITLTLVHDRASNVILNTASAASQLSLISYHWALGASLLNAALFKPIPPSSRPSTERDALWATAGLLGALSFASLEASSPSETWPLKVCPEPSDLDFMRMSSGKKVIWEIADPMRPESMFHPLAADFMEYRAPAREMGYEELRVSGLPKEMLDVCCIDGSSTRESNAYYANVCVLAHLVHIKCDRNNISKFMAFFGCIDDSFRDLLCVRDPAAMILLAWWYGKMYEYGVWWIRKRAYLEGLAICLCLRSNGQLDRRITKCLEEPSRALS